MESGFNYFVGLEIFIPIIVILISVITGIFFFIRKRIEFYSFYHKFNHSKRSHKINRKKCGYLRNLQIQ